MEELLEFTSCFESGNLRCAWGSARLGFETHLAAFQVQAWSSRNTTKHLNRCILPLLFLQPQALYDKESDEYLLFLDHDLHSRGHTQWFYFARSSVVKKKPGLFSHLNWHF